MATRFTVHTAQRTYDVVADRTATFQLLTIARLQSATGAVLPRATLTSHHPDLFVKFSDGFVCLAGVADRLVPQLAGQPYTFSVTVSAPYHQPLTLPLTIPAGSGLPYSQPDPIALRYEPVRIQGRVQQRNGTLAIVPGASITCVDRTLLPLRTPLHAAHAAGTAVNPVTLAPAGILPAPALAAPAAQAATSLNIANRSTLGPGDVLRLGPVQACEYVVVDSLVGAPATTGEVRLTLPVQRSWPAGTAVSPTTVVPAGAARTLVHPVQAGDGLLTLNALPPNPALSAVEIVGANPAETEYHLVGVVSDADGVYRIDGIGQHGALDLHAENGAGTHFQDVLWTLDVRQRINVVNFQLTV